MHYNLRDNYKFEVYHFNTKSYGFNSIQYAGVKLWNSLPLNFKTCDNINVFTRSLDNWKCVNDKCVKRHELDMHFEQNQINWLHLRFSLNIYMWVGGAFSA